MDSKIEVKKENLLSEDLVSQNETEFCVTMERNSDDVTIKTEIKSETPFTKHVKCETVTCSSSNWEIDKETQIEEQTLISDFGSLNEGEFVPENPVMSDKKYDGDHEMNNKVEIKVEPLWLETESSSVCDDIEDGKLPPVKSSREAVSGVDSDKLPSFSVEVPARHSCFHNGKDLECECQKSDVTEMPTAELVLSKQPGSERGENYLKEESLIHNNTSAKNCSFLSSYLSHLKAYDLPPEGKKTHYCKTCDKTFTRLQHLKRHYLTHEGKKPYQCKTCGKCFTRLPHLKTHHLIHEGKKPYQCETCDKSFSQLSYLKTHILNHEDKKPHQCNTCDKSFARLSTLKAHILIHEGKKPHQCKTCDKRFARLSLLKIHNCIHEGSKSHQCEICDMSFTRLSHLKVHLLIHEGKKPHQCKICDKTFAQVSTLKAHILIHEGKKPHQCKTCLKSFTQLSNLKAHNMIHEGKKPHQCKTCGRSFNRLSTLKTHIMMLHESKKSDPCNT